MFVFLLGLGYSKEYIELSFFNEFFQLKIHRRHRRSKKKKLHNIFYNAFLKIQFFFHANNLISLTVQNSWIIIFYIWILIAQKYQADLIWLCRSLNNRLGIYPNFCGHPNRFPLSPSRISILKELATLIGVSEEEFYYKC